MIIIVVMMVRLILQILKNNSNSGRSGQGTDYHHKREYSGMFQSWKSSLIEYKSI